MKPILAAESVGLKKGASSLSLELSHGQSACVLGPGGSGKTRLLRILAGADNPESGSVHALGKRVFVDGTDAQRKATPASIAKRAPGQVNSKSAEALGVLRLAEVRNVPLSDLGQSQQAAARLLQVLVTSAPILLVDDQLDLLDPWALDGALRLLRGQLAGGAVLVASTNRPDLVSFFDTLLILDRHEFRFVGPYDELLRRGAHGEVEVLTSNASSAKAITEPFQVTLRQTAGGLSMSAPDGQAIAARLLLEGYGDVKEVILREPTPHEALMDVL